MANRDRSWTYLPDCFKCTKSMINAVITFSGVICVCVLNSPSDSQSDDMHMQLLHAHSVPACTRSGSPHNVLHSSSKLSTRYRSPQKTRGGLPRARRVRVDVSSPLIFFVSAQKCWMRRYVRTWYVRTYVHGTYVVRTWYIRRFSNARAACRVSNVFIACK